MAEIEHVILVAAVLLLLAVLADKVSGRVGIPPLLLFLGLGMLAGSEGLGGIYFDNTWLTQLVGTVALAFILFAGGLDTDWQHVRPVIWAGLALSTIGVLLSTGLVAVFAVAVLGWSWLDGLLVGAIVAPTDAAAVFSVISAGRVRLSQQLVPLLEFESGTNDPMAVLLTLGLIRLATEPATTAQPLRLVLLFVQQLGLGALFGLVLGGLLVLLVKRLKLEIAGPYPVLTTAAVLFIYGATSSLGGSGFLAVYIAGVLVGNSRLEEAEHLTRFHGGLASLMEIAMFLTLGLLVYPSQLLAVAGVGLLLTACLTVVARPLSVFVSLALARLSAREKAFVSWAGLRGAVPIILATFPRLAGVAHATVFFNLVFFAVLVSVLAQGTTIPLAARWLRVTVPPETA